MPGFDRVEHRAVERIEFLIAASSRAGVKNRVGRSAVKVGITRVDFAEIRQKRDQTPVSLIDAVADFMHFRHGVPRKNLARVSHCKKTSAYSLILSIYA